MDQTHIHLPKNHLPIFGSILGGQIRHTEIPNGAKVPTGNSENKTDD